MMDNGSRNVLINSTLAFISAFVATTFIHEFGHFLSYLVFEANPTLFHNYVQTPDQQIAVHATVVSALVGPVISLIQGICFAVFVSRRKKNTAYHLLYLWLSLLGLVNFFGYLVMTPLSTAGDTGKVATLLNIDYSIRIIIAIVGITLLIWCVLKIGRNFSNFIPAGQDQRMRSKYVYRLMFFPIMIGSVVNTILAFPVMVLLSAIYPATSSYVIMSSFSAILKAPAPNKTKSEVEDKIMGSLIILTVSSIILNRLLTLGVG